MSASGLNEIVVPVMSVGSPRSMPLCGSPPFAVALAPHEALATDLRRQRLRQRVDDGDAHAVEAAGDLVALPAELPAGVQDGEHDLEGALAALIGHRRHGDATPVVGDGAGPVRVEGDLDAVAVAGHRLVDAVVDHLVDEVVEAPRPGRADVHAWALANRFETLEDGDVLRVVTRLGARAVRGCFLPSSPGLSL